MVALVEAALDWKIRNVSALEILGVQRGEIKDEDVKDRVAKARVLEVMGRAEGFKICLQGDEVAYPGRWDPARFL